MDWSGTRTRDSRTKSPMLYPTELSSGGRTGFEPVACGLRRRSPAELSSAREAASRTHGHTPRHRRAHRVGRKPTPLVRVRRSFALPAVARRQSVRAPRRPDVDRRRGVSGRAAEAGIDACATFRERLERKRPRAGTRGRSRASGDRGGRSPREWPVSGVVAPRACAVARAQQAAARDAQGRQCGEGVDGLHGDARNAWETSDDPTEGRARYAPASRDASAFS